MANVKKGERFKDYLLAGLLVAGTVSLSVVAPGVMALVAEEFKKRQFPQKKWEKKKAKRSLYYLQRLKLVSYSEDLEGNIKIRLTKKGRDEVGEERIFLIRKIRRPKRWDRKWRLVIFDIPEKKRKSRDIFRRGLLTLGFVKIGESAYLHPFDCETEVRFLRSSLLVAAYVKFLIVLDFEGVGDLKKKFELS
jgi:hypothetical protein